MLDNLMISIEAVFPLLVFLGLGYGLRKGKLLGEEFIRVGTRLTYFITLPILLFVSVYQSNVLIHLNGTLMMLIPVAYTALFFLLWIISAVQKMSHNNRGTFVISLLRTNSLIVGLPVVFSIFGEEASGIATVAIASIVPLGSLFGVLILSIYGPKEKRKSLVMVIKDIVFHPLMVATFLGLAFLAIEWQIPTLLMKPLEDISKLTTPIALMALGADFSFSRDLKQDPLLSSIIISKLVLIPLVIVLVFAGLGYRGIDLLAPFTVFAAPSAVSNYAMAVEMHANSKLAGKGIILSTMLSPLTLFIFIFVMKSMGLI